MFAKDRLFAQLNLGKDELALYEEVYSRLSMEAPVPDLVVYLQAPVDVLLQRIRRRARPQEKTLSADYLARVNEAYTRFFYHYDDAPVLIVNAESINPIDSDSDFNALLEHIRRPPSGRSYFNPSPLGIN
jgi:deoxyadenosine/deoxycytidine kinase